MKFLRCSLLLFFLISVLGTTTAFGETYTLSPDGSHSNQNQINKALENGNVYLEAGVYEVDNNITIGSNRVLSGDKNAIIRVYSGSSQWFTGLNGVINCDDVVHDVEISGFQIDGNIGNLPKSYADSRSDTSHDCEKLIILHGYSAQFASNIKIHDLKLYDSFSDGIYILFADQVSCYNNVISNCQHEGIYLSCIKNGLFYSNKIAGITSDAGRLDNCVNCKVFSNLFFSYTGDSYGAWEGGQSGLQIADAGASKGYDGSNKPQTTTNIEVYNNTFSDPGRQAVWLDSTGKGVTNVYIHDNEFIDASKIETDGTSVTVISFDNVSVENPPTLEMSEKVFSSIFDILDMELSETGHVNQSEIAPTNKEWKTSGKASAYIYLAGYDGQITYTNETYIPKSASECAIVLTDTQNLASKPSGQSSKLKLTDINNGSLKAILTVKTEYKVKAYKTVQIGDSSIKVPYYKEKSETETFTQIFSAPPTFPTIGPNDINVTVTYQNNSYNPHTLVTVEGERTGTIYNYNGSIAREFRSIGYIKVSSNGFKNADFKPTNTWKFSDNSMSYSYQALYIKGAFDPSKLHITVTTPYDKFEVTEFNYTEVRDPIEDYEVNKSMIVIIIVLFIIIRPLLQELSYNFGRPK